MILNYHEFPPSEPSHIYMNDDRVDQLYGDIEDPNVKLKVIGINVGATLCRVMHEPSVGEIVDIASELRETSRHLWYTPVNEAPFLKAVVDGVLHMQEAVKQEKFERAEV